MPRSEVATWTCNGCGKEYKQRIRKTDPKNVGRKLLWPSYMTKATRESLERIVGYCAVREFPEFNDGLTWIRKMLEK